MSRELSKEELATIYDFLWELKSIQSYKQHTTLRNMEYLEELQAIITRVKNLETEATK